MSDAAAEARNRFAGAERAEVGAFVELPVDEVWDLWTTPAGLERWWWPMFDDTRYEVDAREGGVYRIQSASGGVGAAGQFLEVVKGQRLVFTWNWMTAPGEQLVEVEFAEADDGTIVRVAQTAVGDEVEPIREGWQDALTRLEELDDE